MKMYCCREVTPGYQVSNKIRFTNLKSKYYTNEDVLISYTVHDNVYTSSRDWIGIFPRGWTNLQQYLTFEYAIIPPKTSHSCKRSIIFLHAFHKDASPTTDYQFVYVNRKIQILGTSSYFRFAHQYSHLNKTTINSNMRTEEASSGSARGDAATGGYPPTIVPVDNNDTSKSSIVEQNGTSEAFNDSTELHRAKDLFSDPYPKGSCQFFYPSKFSPEITANRTQFLLSHVDKLAARVERLERDLALAEATTKQEKLAQNSLEKRLEAYELFITDLFRHLDIKGIVKIVDKTGREITIRTVNSKEISSQKSIGEVSELNNSSENCQVNDNDIAGTYRESDRSKKLDLVLDEMKESTVHKMEILKNIPACNDSNGVSKQDSKYNSLQSPLKEDEISNRDKKSTRAALSTVE